MMRYLFTIMLFLTSFVGTSLAQDSSAKSVLSTNDIAIVDVVILLKQSKAAQLIDSQIQAKRAEFKNEITAKEKELRVLEEELIAQKDNKDSESFIEKRKSFERKVRELQASAQKKRFALDKAANGALGQLQNEITKIVGEMAKDNGYKLVLTRDEVVVVTSDIDITAEVMVVLDQKLTKIEVKTE